MMSAAIATGQLPVSIPKRVSEALKLGKSRSHKDKSKVSIPKRVSEALKRAAAYSAK